MKNKKNKSKNIDTEPREFRTRGTRKNQRSPLIQTRMFTEHEAQERISDDEIAIAVRKCFVTCNMILNDMNTMMIK